MNVLRFVISLTLGIVLTLAVQWVDRRHLTPERRERAWNNVSWAAALYAFGPFSMLGWACVTRLRFREAWRIHPLRAIGLTLLLLFVGAVSALAISAAIVGIDWCIATLAGVPL